MNLNFQIDELKMVPNLISLARILLIVPIILLFDKQSGTAYAILIALLVISYVSDYIDGLLARRLEQQSKLGLILDPIADKLWTFVMIFLLMRFREFPHWIGYIIYGRDILILAINGWLLGKKIDLMPSSPTGRMYMVLVGIVIIGYTIRIQETIWLAYAVVVLAPISLHQYTRRLINIARKLSLNASMNPREKVEKPILTHSYNEKKNK